MNDEKIIPENNVASPAEFGSAASGFYQDEDGFAVSCSELKISTVEMSPESKSERGNLSEESITAGSVTSPKWPLTYNDTFSEIKENYHTPYAFLNFGLSPERNIHEKEISSVESSNPGSVVSPNGPFKFNDPTSEQKESCYALELRQTQKYRESLQKNFKKIKKNIDIITMTKKAVDAGLVREDTVSWIQSKKRSKKADLLLTKIIQNIELKDVLKFEEIITQPIADQIKESCKCSTLQVLRSNVCSTTLQCLRAVLIESLRPDDIEDLKDIFIEKFVIDIDDNADIIRHPGFVMNHSNKFVSYFVDKFIIGKSSAGSISCLTQFLRETRNRRLQHILSLLEPESNESMGYVESRSEINRTLTVDQTNSNVNVTEIERKRFEISLTFQQKDQQTDKCCQRVISNVKSKNGVIASTFDGIITDSKEGSIIIHLTSLHEYTLQRVLHCINNEQFSKVLEILFQDEEIKRILSLGTYRLDMAVRQCEDELNLIEKPVRTTEFTQQIADNISFLVEEIDTLLVFEKFRNQAIYLEPGIEVEDRDHRARYIIDIVMSDTKAAEIFSSTLKDMPHVAERLTKYEEVYKMDPILVCKHILNQFTNISETVDLADIRTVFIERKTFEEEELDDIEKEFYHDRRDVMAVFLTEVIKKGDDAMLTLVDSLFVISMDELAGSLMSELKDVFQETKKENASSNNVNTVQMTGQAFDEVLIASATFVLRISKGEEFKSIATKCKEQYIQKSRKVTPQNDKCGFLIDSNMQTKSSTVTSSQEEESKSLGFRSAYALKRPRDPLPDKLKPVHIEKRSRSLQTLSSYTAFPFSGIHNPSATASSSKYANGQYTVTEPNILTPHQGELNNGFPYHLETTYRQATYNREQISNQLYGNVPHVFKLNRSRRSFTGSLSPENTYQCISSDDESNDENKILLETFHHVKTPDVSIKAADQNTLTNGEGIYSAIFRIECALDYEKEKLNNVYQCYAPTSGESINCTSANMIQQDNEQSESSTASHNSNLLNLPTRHLNGTFFGK